MRAPWLRIFVLFVLLGLAACDQGSGGDNTPTESGATAPPEPATITLVSTLELPRSVSRTVSTLTFKTSSSTGATISVSNPIPKAPTITVPVPANSTQLVIDYNDAGGTLVEQWGTPLNLSPGQNVVFQGVNPVQVSLVRSLEIKGPAPVPFDSDTQLTAEATLDNASKVDVTNLVTWSLTGSGTVSRTGVLNMPRSSTATVAAALSQVRSTRVLSANSAEPQAGARPFAVRSDNNQPFTTIAAGERVRVKFMQRFTDGVEREIGPPFRIVPNGQLFAGATLTPDNVVEAYTASRCIFDFFPVTDRASPFTVTNPERPFTVKRQVTTTVATALRGPIVHDFNSDGVPDVAGPPVGSLSTLRVHRGRGDGTFETTARVENTNLTGDGNLLMAAIDLDVDGFQDLVVASTNQAQLVVRSGATGQYRSFALAANPTALQAGDFRSNGIRSVFIIEGTRAELLGGGRNLAVSPVTLLGGLNGQERFGNVFQFLVNLDELVVQRSRTFETQTLSSGVISPSQAAKGIGVGNPLDFASFVPPVRPGDPIGSFLAVLSPNGFGGTGPTVFVQSSIFLAREDQVLLPNGSWNRLLRLSFPGILRPGQLALVLSDTAGVAVGREGGGAFAVSSVFYQDVPAAVLGNCVASDLNADGWDDVVGLNGNNIHAVLNNVAP
ncbi:MAG: VCBS repeat-containing protein [Candidatus Eremiobacteraeota bacterium]|nr:VCBS repeat-containing protein [Candidatus Eremiobacteraeota bacterium]